MSRIYVDQVLPETSGISENINLGASGDVVTLPAGVTLKTNKLTVKHMAVKNPVKYCFILPPSNIVVLKIYQPIYSSYFSRICFKISFSIKN